MEFLIFIMGTSEKKFSFQRFPNNKPLIRKGITIGSRFYLLGVLYAGSQFTAEGILQMSNISNIPKPYVNIPMNFGVVIKADEILRFEEILK